MVTPPSAILDWVSALTGSTAVPAGEPLAGASTATIWPVRADAEQVIVKVYDLGIEEIGADDVERDARAMRAAAELGLTAPRLLAEDPLGERLGDPAIVMTRLAGEPRAHGRDDPDGWVDGLADVLIAVAQAGRPAQWLHDRRPWFHLPVEPPSWAGDPGPWRSMNDMLAAPLPSGPIGFIHRDFHPLNVVWDGGSPVGLVDWVNGCLGPIESDIACCRFNIASADDGLDGLALADRFLQRCLDAGLTWHPLWDLEWLASAGDIHRMVAANVSLGADSTVPCAADRFDEMARRAVAASEAWNG